MTERLPFHFSLSCIGEGNGSPLQCSCLENPRDGGAWWAAVYGVTQSRTQLKRLSSSSSSIGICKPFDSSPVDECKSRCCCLVGLKETGPVLPSVRNLGNVAMENVFLVAIMMGECMLLAFKGYRVMAAGVLNVLQ